MRQRVVLNEGIARMLCLQGMLHIVFMVRQEAGIY